MNRANIQDQSTGFVYSLEFVTTIDGRIRPAFRNPYADGRIFSGSFILRRERKDTNTLTVTFARAAPPFADTDLGKHLASIEARIRELVDQRKGANAALTNSRRRLETFSAPETDGRRIEMLDRIEREESHLREIDREIEAEIARAEETIRRAGAIGTGVAAPAQQQTNQLLLLDAIRDITRQ